MKYYIKSIQVLIFIFSLNNVYSQSDSTDTSFDLANGVYKKTYYDVGKVNVGNDITKILLVFKNLNITEVVRNESQTYLYINWYNFYDSALKYHSVTLTCSEASDLIKYLEYVKNDLPSCKHECEYVFVSESNFSFTVFNKKTSWSVIIENKNKYNSKLQFTSSKLPEIRIILESFLNKCK